MITIFQSALYMTNSAVIETDDLILIVDPCWLPGEVARIRAHVDSLPGGKPRYLLLTHSDFDHILGCGAFPEAIVIGSRPLAAKEANAKEAILEEIRQFDDDYYLERNYPIRYPEVAIPVAQDGEQLAVGGTTLTFYLAPGHTDDGLLTVVEHGARSEAADPRAADRASAGCLFLAGDYLSDVEFPFIGHASEAYLHTLDKASAIVDRFPVAMLLPGHGHPARDRSGMRGRVEQARRYILTLRAAVAARDADKSNALIEGCRFPRSMRKSHDANLRLMERESGADRSPPDELPGTRPTP